MSKLRDQFAPNPDLMRAAEEHAQAEHSRRRTEVDPERRDRLITSMANGDAPGEALSAVTEVELLARSGVDVGVLERLMDAAGKCGATERQAMVTRARQLAAKSTTASTREPNAAPLPDLDVAHLLGDCPILHARVQEVAHIALCLPELPTMAALSVTSCMLAARVVGIMRNRNGTEWRVWPHLYLAAEIRSGMAKSLTRDLIDEERWSSVHGAKCSAVGQMLRDAAALLADRASDDSAQRDAMRRERTKLLAMPEANRIRLREIDRALAQPPLLLPEVKPLHKVTPANFVRVAQRSGFVACLPDEGRTTLEGFATGGPGGQVDVVPLLEAFTGSDYSNSTIQGETRGDHPRFERLHAAMWLPIQPGVLSPSTVVEARTLAKFEQSGLLARLLTSRPREMSVEEAAAQRLRTDIPADTADAWRAMLVHIGTRPIYGDHPLAPTEPIRIPFSPEAVACLLDYQARTTDTSRPGGKHHGKPGSSLVARLADHVARLSTVLAVLREGRADASGVLLQDVERAIRACDTYFEPHCLAVAQRAILDPSADDAEFLLGVIRQESPVRQRELQRKLPRGWDAGRLRRALDELESRGDVQVERSARNAATIRLAG